MQQQDRVALAAHEAALHHQLETGLQALPGVIIHGHARHKAALTSMTFTQAHPYDVAQFLDHHQIAVRVGHHCAQPLLQHLGLSGTLRASIAAYNTSEDIAFFLDQLAQTLEQLQ